MKGARRGVLVLALLAALAIPVVYWVNIAPRELYTDFDVYYRAALRWKEGRFGGIYSFADGASPFRYFPGVLPLFRALSDLDLVSAKRGWFLIQYLAFATGFFLLSRVATRIRRDREGAWAAAIAFLMTLRLVWDTFMIGQVSSLMFAGFALALWAWSVARTPARAGLATFGVFVPAVLKIGPAFVLGLFVFARQAFRRRAIRAGLAMGAAFAAFTWAAFAPLSRTVELVRSWFEIVRHDSSYFDASHYANQSLKGVLLRLDPESAAWLFPLLAFSLCAFTLAFWALRFPRGFEGRAQFFALGLFVYLACMPETFKYSMTILAIPLALVLSSRRKTRLDWIAIGLFFVSISAPAKDFTPDWLFFGLQRASVPALAMAVLGLACARRAWALSRPSHLARWMSFALDQPPAGPWPREPKAALDRDVTWIVPIPLDSQATIDLGRLPALLSSWARALPSASCEWIVVPYGDLTSRWSPPGLSPGLPASVRLLEPLGDVGRGRALREGFLEARGRALGALSFEQPVAADFLAQAWKELAAGAEMVRANRRHPRTRFQIPVAVLGQVYGRHRMGVRFNRLVRLFLPSLRTDDTQSGTFLISRRLAMHAFASQYSSGFLFDLELSLAASGLGVKQADLPVHLHLPAEKKRRRVFSEALAILRGIPILAARWKRGCYRPLPRARAISADDWGLSPGVNRGILALARKGIIRRVSLMADCPYLADGLAELAAIPEVELGLHFNLTYGEPSGTRFRERSAGRLLVEWLRSRRELLPRALTELEFQLDRLDKLLAPTGARISYLDGHHHIHLLPGLIDAMAPVLKSRGIRQVRLPYDPALWLTPRLPLVVLSLAAKRALDRHGFEYRDFFYPQPFHFRDPGQIRARIARNPALEIIVHPADSDDVSRLEIPDPYSSGRVMEYQSLRMLSPSESGA